MSMNINLSFCKKIRGPSIFLCYPGAAPFSERDGKMFPPLRTRVTRTISPAVFFVRVRHTSGNVPAPMFRASPKVLIFFFFWKIEPLLFRSNISRPYTSSPFVKIPCFIVRAHGTALMNIFAHTSFPFLTSGGPIWSRNPPDPASGVRQGQHQDGQEQAGWHSQPPSLPAEPRPTVHKQRPMWVPCARRPFFLHLLPLATSSSRSTGRLFPFFSVLFPHEKDGDRFGFESQQSWFVHLLYEWWCVCSTVKHCGPARPCRGHLS